MSLDQLTQRQKDTGDEIQRLATNYSKDGDDRKNKAYLQQRLQTIDKLWADFEETDTQIRTLYGQRLEHSYFTKNYYDGIQTGYEKFRGQIMSRLPLHKETHGSKDKLPDAPSIKEQDTAQMELKGKEKAADVLSTEPIQEEPAAKVVESNKKTPVSNVRTNQLRVLVSKQQSLMHAIQRTLGNPEGPSESQTLQMRIKTVERHFSVLQELHHKIWSLADAPDTFDYDIESYFNLEEQIQNTLAHLYKQLSQIVQTTNGSRAINEETTTANVIRVKLPKISLPTFDGDYLKWRQFRDLFVELVHNQPIAECQKLWYLKTSLSGEAERLIRHITTSETNYATAWKLINDRYENTRLLVTALINKLLSQQSISVEGPIAIKSMHDSTQECLLALQNLGVPTDQWDPIVIHILVKKLDKTTHALWEQSLAQPRNLQPLNTFLDFLETRFQSLEALGSKGRGIEERRLHTLKSLASTTNTGTTCPAANCKGDHKLFACRSFLQLSPEKRISLVKAAKLCFNCLSTGHNLTACPSGNCTRCSRKHNTLLHPPDKTHRIEKVNANSGKVLASIRQSASTNRSAKEPVTSPPEIDTSISLTTKTAATTRGYILLSTVLVKVSGGNGPAIECRAVLDSGSQVNLITEKMAKKLRLMEIPESMCIEGIGQRKQRAQRRVSLALQSRINGFNTRLEAYVLPSIVSPQPTQMIDISKWPIPNNIQLADPDFNTPKSIDLLIGAELYYTILYIGQIKLSETLPTLQHTAFGWTAGGKITNETQAQATCAILEEHEMDQQLEKFWRLEETTTNTSNFTAAETRCESHFNQTTRRNSNGRFIVRLPFQKDPKQLGESKDVAFQRFVALERRLAKSTELNNQYSQFMNEYINLGHMKEVKLDQIERPYCFLPHHCVIKPDSTTTKLRAVFDASAKTSSNLSLNNILYTGPTIQDDVFSILLRFRIPRFVFTADIEKMYRQIQVEEVDQKFQLIWWRSNENERLKCFKLSTVTYGTTCAPYLATKCLQRLSEEAAVEYPLGAKVLAHDFYVDDVLTGSDSLTNTIAMQDQLKFILHSAGFKLRKWCSNHPRLLENIPEEDRELQLDFTNKSEEDIKTIGLTWLPKTDEFQIRPSWNNKDKVTKRIALSEIAHLFDPLGIMGPVVVIAKIFLQKLWTLKLDWDAALPQELHSSWIKYREGLKTLSSIKIPRHVLAHRVPKAVQIHIFADASEKAYGTAAYLRAVDKDNVVTVRLLCAKSKVAPIKQTTLPRLELCAAKMAVELSERIKRDLTLKNETIYLWTDSEIVLNWINSPSSSFHTFVANRVSTIQQLSVPQQWRHVGSTDNPADVLSRGIAPERLSSCNLWFYGPIFLHGSEAAWPVPYIKGLPKSSTENRHTIAAATTADDDIHFVYSVDHRNSFARLKRIVAYVLRFVSRIRRQSCETMSEPHLSLQELHEAEETIIRQMQDQEFNGDICHLRQSGEVARTSALSSLTPFLDERGIIRVGGRLDTSSLSYDAKHPQLLPYSHQFTKLLINDTHIERYHVGPQALLAILRQKYWPIKGKTLVRSVVQRCVQCAKAKPKFLSQLMGDLPADRVQPARPFVNVGIDFCGPTYTHFKIRGKRPQKSYIAVFCCFSTKATHLEVVSDLSSAGFLGALKRFIGRRGTPRNIYCDNATNFVGAKNQLEEIKDMMTDNKTRNTIAATCSSKGIEFHFIPPRAPHFGGLWEAAVKSAKFMMQRTIASAALTYEELETAVVEIEAILNSRPITPMSSDPNDLMALTPGHFLIGEPLTNSIDPSAQPQHTSLITRWKLVLHIKNEFWRRWSKEYLSQLQHRYKWKQRCQNIEPGHMVIIKEDNTPALRWPLGRIINVIRGNDGLVRVADVRTSSGILRRAIHKLAPLPVEEEQSSTKPVDGVLHSLKPIKCNSNDGQNISKTQNNVSDNSSHIDKDENTSNKGNTSPRKRARRSLGSAIVTLLMTCLMLPTTQGSPLELRPFQSQPGIYFENLGTANIISSEWNIIAYYDMQPYWSKFEVFANYTNTLNYFCHLMKERDICLRTVGHFQHLSDELSRNNDLLLPKNASRVKRGALDFVGNIANVLFGVLDSNYAEKMSETIDTIQQNEDHITSLIRNQTSLIDVTVNVIKRNQQIIDKQFKNLEFHINELTKQINGLKEELHQQRISEIFTSLTIQATLSALNFQRIQSLILNVLIDTHHGKINPQLISPLQLRKELSTIKEYIPLSLRLPTAQDDTLTLYNLMAIEGKIATRHIIFKIKLPLLALEDFELFKVISVPVLINNTFLTIKPSSSFLVINLHRDQYYPLTEQDLNSCTSIAEDKHLCRQKHPIYRKGSTISACEIDLINQLPQSHECRVITIGDGPHWIQLYHPNEWIYVLKQETTVNVVCGSNVTTLVLKAAGILKIQCDCVIKQELVTIQGHNIYPTISRMSYSPSGNLTKLIIPTQTPFSSNETYRYHPSWEDLDDLKGQLQQVYKELPTKSHILGNDVHQFAVSYIGLLLAAAVIVYIGCKFRATMFQPFVKKKPKPAPRSYVSNSNNEDPDFSINFEA